jgi:hypothetical protein
MTWDRLQQLIRTGMQIGGAYLVGDAVAEGEQFQAAIAGVVNVAAFVWWMFKERAATTG